jgi:thiamine kinase-like enzyme
MAQRVGHSTDTATVFCHNDLLCINILYDNAQRIQLIDFTV